MFLTKKVESRKRHLNSIFVRSESQFKRATIQVAPWSRIMPGPAWHFGQFAQRALSSTTSGLTLLLLESDDGKIASRLVP